MARVRADRERRDAALEELALEREEERQGRAKERWRRKALDLAEARRRFGCSDYVERLAKERQWRRLVDLAVVLAAEEIKIKRELRRGTPVGEILNALRRPGREQ